MKSIVLLLLLLAVSAIVTARPVWVWSYQEMFEKADLVVIAKPLSTKATTEKGPILHPHFEVAGLSTEFKTLTVVKGDKTTSKFVLHHYRLVGPSMANAPSFVEFEPTENRTFLMFLTKNPDGRYAAVTGQYDPAFSIVRLDRDGGDGL